MSRVEADHVTLWGTSANSEGGGHVGSKIHSLVGEKIHNPAADMREAKVALQTFDPSNKKPQNTIITTVTL